jgi:hypothetical protein
MEEELSLAELRRLSFDELVEGVRRCRKGDDKWFWTDLVLLERGHVLDPEGNLKKVERG